jgi:hypothetical protein
MWYSSGDVDSGEKLDLSTGARARHGDRIIGAALCLLGMKEQPKAAAEIRKEIPLNSFAWRKKKYDEEQEKNKRLYRQWRY